MEEQSHEDGIAPTSTTFVNGAVEGALSPCVSIDNHEDQQHDELDKRVYAQVGGVLGSPKLRSLESLLCVSKADLFLLGDEPRRSIQ